MMLLVIRDGWGVYRDYEGNAVFRAKPQGYLNLLETSPRTTLEPGGERVGLPEGQMGNSEVGHLNIGAGRIVYQDLPRISLDLRTGDFFERPAMREFLEISRAGGRVHLLGLVSDGGVHSHIEHIKKIVSGLKNRGIQNLFIHAFLDGRDTPPRSGAGYLQDLESHLNQEGLGKIATICGRFYAMDRDKRWERVEKAYRMLVHGEGETFSSVQDCMNLTYEKGITDEFVLPSVLEPEGCIRKGDHVFFINFRPDRAREISFALTDPGFSFFPVENLELNYLTMTPYAPDLKVKILYDKENITRVLSEVIASKGLKQLKIAETEKYAHVTYFLNGGREEPFEGEDRILVPSPKVHTYDLKPEMSAYEVTEKLEKAILSEKYDLIVVNYANPDMVGHTGSLEAATRAAIVVDECVTRILQATARVGGSAIVTADHGNLDEMISEKGEALTNHSLNPVDFIFVPAPGDRNVYQLKPDGKLADIAPSILHYMGIEIPKEMNGDVLFMK